ncbi:MAG: UvrD-helicase domain-containing protein [Anaerolineae bacterium]|nr:UvrD-helicase domain-containing protein [Anaerolineae bacterium]
MKFVADLHIHSHYSRATSKDLNFEHLSKWAQLKGVHVVGTGDIAHPGWLLEMKEKLEPAEEGLFRLKDEYAKAVQNEVFKVCHGPVRFMLAGEISSIYKKNDKVRKIHNVIFAPTLEAVEKIQAALEKIGNIRSDGRPILGLDSRDLLEIILDIDPQNYLIPAHIWTPWFALLGSKSGFDSVEECFDDLTPHIFALETGLSSDPPMNWRISALDRYTLVSNSDAHSPQKLAREANQFDTELSYPAIFAALKSGDPAAFSGTIEFFPEEGKYHYDGHRKCEIRWHPQTTLAHRGLCSVCGKPVTVGVMHRVESLADRPEGTKPPRPQRFQSLVPLPEVLAEVYNVGAGAKQTQQRYEELLVRLGPELAILQDIPLEEIEGVGGPLLAEGIRRMRSGEVSIAGGYDGEYGVIKLFEAQERATFTAQLSMFVSENGPAKPKRAGSPDSPDSRQNGEILRSIAGEGRDTSGQWQQAELFAAPSEEARLEVQVPQAKRDLLAGLNPQQREAALCTDVPLVIVAGPGTGKTRTLTYRIAYLIAEKGVDPAQILAITFTNKAAAEMAVRLTALVGPAVAGRVVIKTFHAFGAMILREAGEQAGLNPKFIIASDSDQQTLLRRLYPEWSEKEINEMLEQISAAKNRLLTPDTPELAEAEFVEQYRAYEAALQQNQLLGFDDLILRPVKLFETLPEVLKTYQQRFRWISVDEYQDINYAQYRLLRLLTAPETNLCVIGDPDQAIYGFRGASHEYFLKFQADFPEARVIHLSQNYRSTQLILDASSQVIAKGTAAERIKVWSEFLDQTKLDIYQAPTDKAEAEYVVHQIEKMVGGTSYFSLDSERVTEDDDAGRSFADFAVLYRLGTQSQLLIEAFQRSGMPFQTFGQTPFYEHKEIKAILACLWFIYNPASTFRLEQAVSKKQLKSLTARLNDLRQAGTAQPVGRLIESINQHLAPDLDEKRAERIQQLLRRAAPFENRLPDFLESTVLQKETDAYDPRADRVTLMTLHAAKGLEFPVVFVVGCEENLLPFQMEGKSFDLAEERRLFYVGMTRAQHKLILTHAKTRFLFGQKQQNEPSRFLADIENALKEIKAMAARKPVKEKPDSAQLKLF